jgi:DNA-binding transcriptional MerR regulator
MLKVGEFAQLAGVSVRLLHYYDKRGLLSPACVEPFSGYRYYTADQITRLYRILALKDLGLSLEEVARLVDGELTPDELRGMLMLKQAELRQRITEEQARLDRVQERLRLIEQAGKLPEIDVIVKPVPALHVLSLRRAVKNQPPHYVFAQASVGLRARGLSCAVETVIGRYHSRYMALTYSGLRLRVNLFEAAFVIDAALAQEDIPLESGGRLRVREFPAVEMMACVVHRGADSQRHLAHHALLHWMALQGFALAGPQREVYLWRAQPNLTSDEHVTEIQNPITRINTTSANA